MKFHKTEVRIVVTWAGQVLAGSGTKETTQIIEMFNS